VITYILLELFVNYYIHSFQKIFCCENINFIQFFDIFRTYCWQRVLMCTMEVKKLLVWLVQTFQRWKRTCPISKQHAHTALLTPASLTNHLVRTQTSFRLNQSLTLMRTCCVATFFYRWLFADLLSTMKRKLVGFLFHTSIVFIAEQPPWKTRGKRRVIHEPNPSKKNLW
jgi:hypothetical protein